MRSNSLISILLFLALGLASAQAGTRVPRYGNESSLLYWRYLCENHPQQEKAEPLSDSMLRIELKCPSQHWMVRSEGGQVIEVVENAK